MVNLSTEIGQGTLVGSEIKVEKREENLKMEKTEVIAVNSNTQVACLRLKNTHDLTNALSLVAKSIRAAGLATPQIIYERLKDKNTEIFLNMPEEGLIVWPML